MNNDIRSYDEGTKRAALIVSTLSGFLTPFMGSSMNVALPAVASEFSMKAVSLSWVQMAYMLAAAVSLVPFGRLGDIRGRKKVFILGLVVYTLASLLAALSFSAASLIVFRVLQGIGGAMIMGTSLAILTSIYPAGDRGRVLGINVAAVYLGGSLGPVLGGLLTQHFGWRSLFLVVVPVGIPALVLAFAKLPSEPPESRGETFDTAGTILFGAGLASLMIGFSLLPGVSGIVFILLGLAGLAVFVLWEKKSEAPVLDIRHFRTNRVFAFSNAAALINYSATSAVAFLLSLYLQYIKGMSPQQAGLILIAQPVVMTVFSPLAGKLSDRIEPRIVASIGMGITSAGLFMFMLLGRSSSLFFIVSTLLCLGFGFALFSSPNINAVMGSVDRCSYGVASSTLATMRLTGQMFSLGVSVVIFALFMGNVRITPEYHPAFLRSLVGAFAVFGVLCVIGVFASLARGNRKSGTQYQFPN